MIGKIDIIHTELHTALAHYRFFIPFCFYFTFFFGGTEKQRLLVNIVLDGFNGFNVLMNIMCFERYLTNMAISNFLHFLIMLSRCKMLNKMWRYAIPICIIDA